MTVREFYDVIGGNYADTLSRFLSEERMKRFALKFEADPSFSDLCAALEAKDADEAFRAAHTLKGVCQNLGFDCLYGPAFRVTEILRSGDFNVGADMDELRTCYGVVMSAVRALRESDS